MLCMTVFHQDASLNMLNMDGAEDLYYVPEVRPVLVFLFAGPKQHFQFSVTGLDAVSRLDSALATDVKGRGGVGEARLGYP
jgi:hypothetical protein